MHTLGVRTRRMSDGNPLKAGRHQGRHLGSSFVLTSLKPTVPPRSTDIFPNANYRFTRLVRCGLMKQDRLPEGHVPSANTPYGVPCSLMPANYGRIAPLRNAAIRFTEISILPTER